MLQVCVCVCVCGGGDVGARNLTKHMHSVYVPTWLLDFSWHCRVCYRVSVLVCATVCCPLLGALLSHNAATVRSVCKTYRIHIQYPVYTYSTHTRHTVYATNICSRIPPHTHRHSHTHTHTHARARTPWCVALPQCHNCEKKKAPFDLTAATIGFHASTCCCM